MVKVKGAWREMGRVSSHSVPVARATWSRERMASLRWGALPIRAVFSFTWYTALSDTSTRPFRSRIWPRPASTVSVSAILYWDWRR